VSPEELTSSGTAAPELLLLESDVSPDSVVLPERPGSRGEHFLQCAFETDDRASRFYNDQVLDHLNEAMASFVTRMEMAFIATSDADGECDSTLRAGPPGFIQVLAPRRLAYPEYRGNGVMASLANITDNPHVGLLMMDFVDDVIGLHVNGRASIVEDPELRAENPWLPVDPSPGRQAERWVVVDVDEAYIHCSKHIPRLARLPRARFWRRQAKLRRNGGDFFGAIAAREQ
jgi:predicted pyridoxine 5'-phosphate oxidase superfamily flavin-nucleotide-binding protein